MTPDALSTRSEVLIEVAESVASHQSLPELLLALSPSLAKLVPLAGVGLVLYDADRCVSRLYHLESSVPHGIPSEYEFTAEQSPTATVLETRQPLYFPDLEAETRYPALMRMLRDKETYRASRCARCRWFELCKGNFRCPQGTGDISCWFNEPACYLTDAEIGL